MMHISIFKTVKDAYVVDRLDIPWTEAIDFFQQHQEIDSKESSLMFNLGRFRTLDDPEHEAGRNYHYIDGVKQKTYDEIPGTVRRSKHNLLAISGIVLDVDDFMTIADVKRRYRDLEFVIYTTFRHNLTPGVEKFRVVFPFTQELLKDDLTYRIASMQTLFAGVDPSCFTQSQSFYFHSGKKPVTYYNKGIIIDPYQDFPEVIPPPPPVTTHVPVPTEEVDLLARELHSLYPKMERHMWIRVTWAFCHELGYDAGIQLMKQYWPEWREGEYSELKGAPSGKPVTLGTVRHYIKQATQNTSPARSRIAAIGQKLKAKYLQEK